MKEISLSTIFAWLFSSLGTAAYDPNHAQFTELLSANVKDGVVNYEGLRASTEKLSAYLAQIGEVPTATYDAWPKDEQMAYLINAYNAFTLKLIVDFYPVESIRDIGPKVGSGLFGGSSRQWKVSSYELAGKKTTFTAMGKPVTLDEIEHDTLRPKFKDARVHFALVCGALSCPYLRSEAYTGSKLSAQLDNQGKLFLADPFRNRYDEAEKKLRVSKIFDWFKGDFERDAGSLYEFLKRYLPAETVAKAGEKPDIRYLDYDWSLNSKAGKL